MSGGAAHTAKAAGMKVDGWGLEKVREGLVGHPADLRPRVRDSHCTSTTAAAGPVGTDVTRSINQSAG